MAWRGWSAIEKSYFAVERNKRLSAVNKQNGGLISTFPANQVTDDYCDVLV